MRIVPSTDGVELAAYDFGGDGPPLLLVHATGFHAHVMEPLAARLAPHFHCYAFDQRAHGRSTPPQNGFHWRGLGDDAAAVVRAFELHRPFGVGHSSGGAALLMAEQDNPGLFRALWCYEPVVFPVDPPLGPQPDNPLAVATLRRREVFASRDDAYANFAAKPPLDALDPEVLRAYVDHGFADTDDGQVRLRCHREHEAAMYQMGAEHDAFPRFGEVGCPVVIAGGGDTDAITPAVIQAQAARLRQVRTRVLPGLGHFGLLSDPDRLAAEIVAGFQVG